MWKLIYLKKWRKNKYIMNVALKHTIWKLYFKLCFKLCFEYNILKIVIWIVKHTYFYKNRHRTLHTRVAMINYSCSGKYDKRRKNESRFSQHSGESISFPCSENLVSSCTCGSNQTQLRLSTDDCYLRAQCLSIWRRYVKLLLK